MSIMLVWKRGCLIRASFVAAPDGEVLVQAGAAPDIIVSPIEKAGDCRTERLPYHQDIGKSGFLTSMRASS